MVSNIGKLIYIYLGIYKFIGTISHASSLKTGINVWDYDYMHHNP